MKTIATIEEIRKTRKEISRKCEFDPKQLVKYYIERQNSRVSTNSPTESRKRDPVG